MVQGGKSKASGKVGKGDQRGTLEGFRAKSVACLLKRLASTVLYNIPSSFFKFKYKHKQVVRK